MEVYFDNSSTTKPFNSVVDEVAYTMRNYYANPSSAHSLGFKAEQKLRACRESISKNINANTDEIIFTSGGSESNNFLIKGFCPPNTNIITSTIEHPSVKNTFRDLENKGIKVSYIEVDNVGKIKINQILNAINKETSLVSIMHVNNEIGVIQDIEKLGNILKEKPTPRGPCNLCALVLNRSILNLFTSIGIFPKL